LGARALFLLLGLFRGMPSLGPALARSQQAGLEGGGFDTAQRLMSATSGDIKEIISLEKRLKDTGGAAGGVVHLGGEVWRGPDAPSLLAAVARSAVAARDPRHPVALWR
jgi:hypothetical protein